jgi:CRP/FNR family cyclic AMP-dependent transcriptional regulator
VSDEFERAASGHTTGMVSAGRSSVDVACVLDQDPELRDVIAAKDVDDARALTRVPVVWTEAGGWKPPPPSSSPNHFGLLVLDGLALREVMFAGMGCTELLGPGDLLRPADQQAAFPSVPFRVSFVVDKPLRLALLDERFAAAVRRWPALSAELVARTVRRSQSLAMHLAITCITGTELRVHVVLWHLADRFGHVTPDGVVVPLRLTHETLGRLVRGRRPAISTALKRLAARGAVHRRDDGSWLLCGGPPDELTVVRRGGARPDGSSD